MCPMLDDRNDTPSAVQMAGLGIWDLGANHVGSPSCTCGRAVSTASR